MKLNLGCGMNRQAGYINVDCFAEAQPDMVWDLEVTPWPWETSSADEILMNHSLEHMGATTPGFFSIMKELYRVCKPDGRIVLHVPHPRHDSYLTDPTHVRPITPFMFGLFSKRNNREWEQTNVSNTPLGLYLDVDFRVAEANQVLDPYYADLFNSGGISEADLNRAIAERNNVVIEYQIVLSVVKEA